MRCSGFITTRIPFNDVNHQGCSRNSFQQLRNLHSGLENMYVGFSLRVAASDLIFGRCELRADPKSGAICDEKSHIDRPFAGKTRPFFLFKVFFSDSLQEYML